MTTRMIHPDAQAYGERVTAMSDAARARCRVEEAAYGADPLQKLDIWLPEGSAGGPHPVLVFLHGGARRAGNRHWMGFLAPLFLDLPAIFVSVGYRLSPVQAKAILDLQLQRLTGLEQEKIIKEYIYLSLQMKK